MKYTGVVSRSMEKTFGDKKSYTFFLDGVEGVLFKLGHVRPSFKEGALIEFEANETGKVMPGTLKSLSHRGPEDETSAPATTSEQAQVSRPAGSYRDLRAESDALRNRSIVRQVALKLAAETVFQLVDRDMVKLPATQAKKLDTMLALMDKLTERFYADLVVDHGDAVKAETETSTPADAGDADESGEE